MSDYLELLKKLTNAHGVPGFEGEATSVMKGLIKNADDILIHLLFKYIVKY